MTDLDTAARAAVGRARAEVAAVDVPPAGETTARRVAARGRRTAAVLALATVAIAGGSAIAIGATRSDRSTKPSVAVAPTSASTSLPTTPTVVKRPQAVLQFREVIQTQPSNDCKDAEPSQNPLIAAALPDRTHQNCYAVGPPIAGNFAIKSAEAFFEHRTGTRVINVEFVTDDFAGKVATPYVNRQVAIVIDGVVQSAPTINPGIAGRNITISGNFTVAESNDLARRLAP